MKRLGTGFAFMGFMALFLLSCFDPPEYSNIPAIEFEKVTFVDVANTSDPDSLIIIIPFKDGDGDLGLDANDPTDTLFPFQSRTFFDTIPGSQLGYYFPRGENIYITYRTKRTNPNYDTLPPFSKPYNCVNWEILQVNNQIDTFYFQRNPYHYNINVDFLVKNSDGTFTEFDWTKEFSYPQCGITFDGRFPILSRDLSRSAALDGKIRYGMASTGFNVLFNVKPIKLRVTIFDRALNRSNTVETPEFTLQQIRNK